MTYAEWLAKYTLLIGSDGDDDDTTDDDDASRDKGGVGNDDMDANANANKDKGGKGGSDDDAGDEDDSEVKISARELENIRQENARLKREDRKRQNKEKADKEQKQREEGKHEEIAREREEERDEAKTLLAAKEYELDQKERGIRTRDAASALNFREPEDAIRFLSDDETDTDEHVTKALKKLAEKKAYLLNDRPRSGRAGNGSGTNGDGGLTREEIMAMSPAEVAKRMPEVHEVLRKQQPIPAGGRS